MNNLVDIDDYNFSITEISYCAYSVPTTYKNLSYGDVTV